MKHLGVGQSNVQDYLVISFGRDCSVYLGYSETTPLSAFHSGLFANLSRSFFVDNKPLSSTLLNIIALTSA